MILGWGDALDYYSGQSDQLDGCVVIKSVVVTGIILQWQAHPMRYAPSHTEAEITLSTPTQCCSVLPAQNRLEEPIT